MTYRPSTDPDPPNLGEAWGYLTACGISRDLAKSHAATFRLADVLYHLVGPDPSRVPRALGVLERLEKLKASIAKMDRGRISNAVLAVLEDLETDIAGGGK